jgi:hypothetical protein
MMISRIIIVIFFSGKTAPKKITVLRILFQASPWKSS